MVNNTETYWEADGESLHTYAHSIESLTGLMQPPSLRGNDGQVAYLPGDIWEEKVPESRILPLGMWVIGSTMAEFQSNWNDLVRLLWTPGRQFDLTKRFYDGGLLRVATAKAEYSGGMSPSMIGQKGARCVVDVKLADPYFYDDTPQVFNLVDGDNTINIRGNSPTRNIIATINGARDNTIIRVKSPGVAHQFQYNGSLAASDVATISSQDYTSMTSVGGAPAFDTELLVTHTGSRYWMILQPGDNVVNLTSDFGIGSVQLTVRGAWV